MNENKKVYALLGQHVEFNKVDTVWVAVIPDRTMIAMEEHQAPLLSQDIDCLLLTVRTSNCLRAEKINTVRQLLDMRERDLLVIPNFGRRCLGDVKQALAEHDFYLKGDKK